MNKKLILVLEITIALAALLIGYIFVAGRPGLEIPARANPSTAPVNPNVLYLALEGTSRGASNDQAMKDRGATPVRSWEAVREAAGRRPLDGLLIDATFFETMTDADKAWLQNQFRNGVVTVGLGVNEDQLAQYLGLTTLRSAGEPGTPNVSPAGYLIVSSLILGHPDDIEKLEQANWLDQKIQNGAVEPAAGDITYPAITKFSKARGQLDSDEDLDFLFERLKLKIEGVHQTRVEYQNAVENFNEQ